jgi:effector-binding domain-containing protein
MNTQNLIMAIEEPKYTVLDESGNIEIRQYQQYIVAETIVSGDLETVSDEGFRRLVDYIGGENIMNQSIEMTAPVNQEKVESAGQKIEMTAPVNQEAVDSANYRISFVMPERFTLETVPRPKDNRIKMREVPAKTVVAIRYSGTWSRSNYEKHLEKLVKYIEENDLEVTGNPVWARYNPPFMPWFMRRNEILLELE